MVVRRSLLPEDKGVAEEDPSDLTKQERPTDRHGLTDSTVHESTSIIISIPPPPAPQVGGASVGNDTVKHAAHYVS